MFYVVLGLTIIVLLLALFAALGKLKLPAGKEGIFVGFLGLCVSVLLGLLVFVVPRDKWPQWARDQQKE